MNCTIRKCPNPPCGFVKILEEDRGDSKGNNIVYFYYCRKHLKEFVRRGDKEETWNFYFEVTEPENDDL
jgi:hypothetical protein